MTNVIQLSDHRRPRILTESEVISALMQKPFHQVISAARFDPQVAAWISRNMSRLSRNHDVRGRR